ncbi:hypothetical protein GVX82_03710 [Patescibacteria group bacterium]|jgi:hypothetical protein|nr:hypothetical protein [Patescibacteria group bacterium]
MTPATFERKVGVVWLVSAVSVALYALGGLLVPELPGLQQLIALIERAEALSVFATIAFVAGFLEGIYVLGNFFPGSTIVVLVAVLAGVGGVPVFLVTILSVFLGWSLAGGVNVLGARRVAYTEGTSHPLPERVWLTWLPSFRASQEVARTVAGASVLDVLVTSTVIKFWTSCAMLGVTALLPFVIDITKLSNEEGFASLLVGAVLMAWIGVLHLRAARQVQETHEKSAA